MNFKRFFSNEPAKRQLLTGYFKDNSATITLLLGVAGGAFTFGLYLNQIKIYEEQLKSMKTEADVKLNSVKIEAEKDSKIAEEKLKTQDEKIKSVKIEAEEKIKSGKIEAEKEYLQLLYNIFTQEEFKEAKKKLLAMKKDNVNTE